ncbi:MAG: hypothetical protein QOJ62_149 [Actinomycetota bacterium]|jgi:hypothetical protein|nr:hypothetical protein [Actinomycetota bacterium]
MNSPREPVNGDQVAPEPVASLQLDDVELPIYDLGDFNAADMRRVSSFVTNFGSWKLPDEVIAVLGADDAGLGSLEWIHDTGELVLLGGTPTSGEVSAEVSGIAAATAGVPAFLGGTAGNARGDGSGMVREFFRSELMPAGSRVALLAHVAHGPKAHELLWGWHRKQRTAEGWTWLVERLARLDDETADTTHLG